MKREVLLSVLLVIITLALLVFGSRAVGAADVSLFVSCIERESESGLPRVWFGYEAGAAVSGTGYMGDSEQVGFIGFAPNALQAGRFEKVFGAELQVPDAVAFFQFVTDDGEGYEVFADASNEAIDCAELESSYGPDGGLRTITKDVAPGCYEWSIQDDYGHWSIVATTCSQQEGERVFVRLVLGRDNPVTDPDRYRVWRVDEGRALDPPSA